MERNIRVLHILNELNYSGAEVMLNSAFTYFVNANIESHILSTGKEMGSYYSTLEKTGYLIKHIPFDANIKYLILIFKYLRQNKYDVVQIHAERANFWYSLICKLNRVKKILRTVHACFPFYGWTRAKKVVQRNIMRNLFRVHFHAVSIDVKKNEKVLFFNDCLLINNFIDINNFYPAVEGEKEILRKRFGIPLDAFVLISVGSCEEVKNHKIIIEALSKLFKIFNGFFYFHVGTGKLEAIEKKYACETNLSHQIIFAGEISEVRNALAASDLFLMPSSSEGLGNTILEALAVGIPVIGFNVKGINSVITDKYNGLLCDPNCGQLVNAVLMILNNSDFKNNMIINGFQTVRDNYTVEESCSKLVSLYTAL